MRIISDHLKQNKLDFQTCLKMDLFYGHLTLNISKIIIKQPLLMSVSSTLDAIKQI